MTGLADQVEVTRLTVGMLKPETTLTKIDLPGNTRVHHPLQRAVDGCPTDLLIFTAHQINEIVGAEMPFLAKEHVDNLFPLTGPFPARKLEPGQILKGGRHLRGSIR